jgi:hypothetical protein
MEELDGIFLIDRENGRKFFFSGIIIGEDMEVSFETSWIFLENDPEDVDYDEIEKRGIEIFREFFTNALKEIIDNDGTNDSKSESYSSPNYSSEFVRNL